MRVCPACDTRTDARTCPRDGRPTVDEAEFASVERLDPLIGYRLLEKYEVEKKLGSGGFGSVYRARHLQTGGNVAVKLLLPEVAGDADAVRRFYIEAQNTHKLKHPNTVTVSDFGRADDGLLYLIMEHVDGTPLSAALRAEGRLSPSRVVHIIEQVLKSLHEAHGYRIVHRDIKPENIMLLDQFLEKDFVKVLDFGISRSLDSSGANTAGRALGTPRYMAPEQWRGQDLDGRADLYSVGCMAYQMLAGRAPFYFEKGTQSGIYAYMHAHLHASPPPLSEVAPGACPLELEALILSMLAKDRLARPASAQETLGRLSAIRAAGGLADATTGHVAATSSDALPGFAMTEAEANLTARISVGPVAVARGGGRTTPMPSATLPEPQPAPRLTERVPAIAARLPDDAGSTGVPLRDALPPLSPPAPVSGAAVAASVVALLLMATAAGYWLTRENSSSGGAAQSQSPAPDPAASVAGMDPVVPQQPAPEPATAPPTEVGAATAVSAALSVGIASPDPIADAEPPAAAPVAEAPAFAEPAAEATAESGDQESLDAPAAVPDPAPPEPAPPARTVVSVASEPAGAEVRRKGDADVLGTTPFDWTLTDVDLETLTARRPIPLTLSHANGQTGKADLTSVHLDAERPELTAKLTSPKPRPRPAVKGAAVRPAPKAKPKPAATGSFHF